MQRVAPFEVFQKTTPPKGRHRVIYLYIPEANWFYRLDISDKDEQEDVAAGQKRELSKLAAELKREARAALRRRSRSQR